MGVAKGLRGFISNFHCVHSQTSGVVHQTFIQGDFAVSRYAYGPAKHVQVGIVYSGLPAWIGHAGITERGVSVRLKTFVLPFVAGFPRVWAMRAELADLLDNRCCCFLASPERFYPNQRCLAIKARIPAFSAPASAPPAIRPSCALSQAIQR